MKHLGIFLLLASVFSVSSAALADVITGAEANHQLLQTLSPLQSKPGTLLTAFAVWPSAQPGNPCKLSIDNQQGEGYMITLATASGDDPAQYPIYIPNSQTNISRSVSDSNLAFKFSGKVTMDEGDRQSYTAKIEISHQGGKTIVDIGGQSCSF